jgi:hypothetical protein
MFSVELVRTFLSYSIFNLLDISADSTMIKIKEKSSQNVDYVKTIVHQKHENPIFYI